MANQQLVFNTLKTAARTAAAEGHSFEAQAIFRRLAALIEREIGKDNVEYAMCIHELADVYAEQKSWTAAEEGYREALEVYRHWLADTDPTFALVLRSLADVHRHTGNALEAKRLEHEAAAVLAKKLSGL